MSVDHTGRRAPDPSVLSRRTILRTAAHAAWAVPAIQIATAAPAFAISATTTIAVTANVLSWSNRAITGTFQLRVTVSNKGSTAADLGTVTLQFPSGWNPTATAPRGWTRSGSGTTTIVFSPAARTLAAGASVTFTTRLNPVDSKVGAGSYTADGGGLLITATATNASPKNTAVDLAGAYANLIVTEPSGSWASTAGTFTLTSAATVVNRGRTATRNLQLRLVPVGLGSPTVPVTTIGSGWVDRSSYFEWTSTELRAAGPEGLGGGSAPFTASTRFTGGDAGTDGTVQFTPSDATLTTEVARPATANVPAL